MTHPRFRTILSFVVFVLVIGAGLYYFASNPELLLTLKNISVAQAMVLVFLRLLFLGSNGLFLKASAAKFDIKLARFEWFGLPFVTTMGNHLTPLSGGMLMRATYLKYQHTMPYATFAALLAASYLITFWVMGAVGFLLSLLLYRESNSVWILGLLFLLTFGSISLLMVAPNIRLPGRYAFVKLLNNSLTGWALVKNDRKLLLELVCYTSIGVFLNGAAFWLAYISLDLPVSPPSALLVSLSSAFSALLTLTPGNFGIREAIIGLTSELAGVGIGEGVLVALLIRTGTLISVFTLGPLFSFILARQIHFSRSEEVEK